MEGPLEISLKLLALHCVVLIAACTSGTEGGPTGNTELNLDIVNPGGTSGELGFSIDRVDYRITCAGNPPGSYPIPDADTTGTLVNYDDSVDISGAFETVDTRVPPVWQAVMDLPPGLCTITLSVWDGNEVVCIGSQTLTINEEATTKYDIVLVCSLSIDLPDGMADVDGEFFFITGNLCPKLYLVNAIPQVLSATPACTATQLPCLADADCQPPSPGGIPSQLCEKSAEVQYRAKDPDNTCGSNCDPQTCTFDNPPVCTPAPYNPNDPLCNPAAGGDPSSAACQDGVSAAGLVCTISAVPPASGVPGGTFISPNDLVSPTGPVLPVNLNTASGLPGIILPGLGGPVTTRSEPSGGGVGDNPLYPGLPNANGSLPPLRYVCDSVLPGDVIINVHCSDGDEECDQNKQIIVSCGTIDPCINPPPPFTIPDCSAPSECTTPGTGSDLAVPGCDPLCDPANPDTTGSPGNGPPCEVCPGQGAPQPAGTACTIGGNVCDGAGNCVECVVDADCLPVLPPVECQEDPTCVANSCVAGVPSPAGTLCSNGLCDGINIGPDSPPCGGCSFGSGGVSCSGIVTVGCGNNVTADVSILPYQLDIFIGTGVVGGNPIVGDLDGVAQFSEPFLDAAQGAVPGGVTKAVLVDLVASVQVRSGSTGAPVTPLGAGSVIPYECLLGDTGVGAQQPCDPINDQASVPGLQPNTDCIPTGSFNPCGRIVQVPTSTDCAPGGVCDTLGKSSQCAANGFCATGGLPLPLDPVSGAHLGTADASGNLLVGWYDTPADASVAVGTPPIDGDGTYNMQQPTYTGVAGPIGLAVNAGGLAVQLECVMAEDSGGPLGVGVPDDASPTPDFALCSFPIQVLGGSCP